MQNPKNLDITVKFIIKKVFRKGHLWFFQAGLFRNTLSGKRMLKFGIVKITQATLHPIMCTDITAFLGPSQKINIKIVVA